MELLFFIPMIQSAFKLSQTETKVFKIHLLFSAIQGIITGVFALNELIFIKDLGATDFQLSLLLQFASLVMLLSLVIYEFLRRVQDKQKMLVWGALITHLPLLVLLFFPTQTESYTRNPIYHFLFLSIFLFYYLNQIIILPLINQLLKENYTHNNFGRLYSHASLVNKILIMIATMVFGLLLDQDGFSFVAVYPLMAILGIVSVMLLASIPFQRELVLKNSFWQSLKNSFIFAQTALKSNRAFLHFELGFMFYGFAWMISTVLIPVYFNEVFAMNHATYGFFKNGYNIIAIALLPFFGKLIGKIDVRKFAIITFIALLFYTVILAFSKYYTQFYALGSIKIYYSLVLAYTIYGVFAATMALLWFIGSAYFCQQNETARYQSIHLSFTGFRAIFSFQLGIVLYLAYGMTIAFIIAAFSLLISVLIMYYSYRKYPSKPINTA